MNSQQIDDGSFDGLNCTPSKDQLPVYWFEPDGATDSFTSQASKPIVSPPPDATNPNHEGHNKKPEATNRLPAPPRTAFVCFCEANDNEVRHQML